jgi:DNA polymerase III delta prime subunit
VPPYALDWDCKSNIELPKLGETMSDDQGQSGPGAEIAGDILGTLERVERQAIEGQRTDSDLTADSIGVRNPARDTVALQTLGRINSDKAAAYDALSREPAIARVVVRDAAGVPHTYYVCRTSPPAGLRGVSLISYRSPLGALASRSIGSTFVRPDGQAVELGQRARLRPVKQGAWDSRDSVFESEDFGTVTVVSLRELLAPAIDVDEKDPVAALLAAEEADNNVIEGMRRSVIRKMTLRDQPVLDQYQDSIFRLPLASRLLILGPPGTGKTTTLIRRLGQKLDVVHLEDDERELARRLESDGGLPYAKSWVMFTPTDLLRHYVKEAFALEGIAASEQRISTWTDHRNDLARNRFNILRTGTSSATFILKEAAASLTDAARGRPTEWFADFDRWQKTTWIDGLRQAAQALVSEPDGKGIPAVASALAALKDAGVEDAVDVVVALSRESRALLSSIAEMREFTDGKLKEALNLQVRRNKAFLVDLARFIDTLQDPADIEEDEDEDDAEAEDDDEGIGTKTGLAAAVLVYQRVLRSFARARAIGKSLSKSRRTSRIVEWLGDRGLPTQDLAAVGRSLVQQSRARRLVYPARSFINQTPQRYRTFRRMRQSEASWYAAAGSYLKTDLHPLELDVVLLALLRNGTALLQRNRVRRDLADAPEWEALRHLRGALRHQVLVDEATDFSPTQLACMVALADPGANSFFACGDFNQRLTTWGSRSLDDVKWACPELTHQTITIAYRQSTQLNELAKGIVRLGDGHFDAVALPKGANNDGKPPVLAEGLVKPDEVAAWLAARIREVEAFVKMLPSIAVLVTSEEEVEPLARCLNEHLVDNNIRAVPCRDGQSIGKENDVRVFDIQHIKGLEFEAVFFVGVDRLVISRPDLYDKYLYVGTTRAAAHLGMTCEAVLPPTLEALRPMFVAHW